MSRTPRKPDRDREEVPPLSPLRLPPKPLTGLGRGLLALLIGLYLALGSLHAVTVPSGSSGYQNAPDEYAHRLYVESVSRGRFPSPADAVTEPRAYEWHQPPLYYLLAARFAGPQERGLRFVSLGLGVIGLMLIFRAARLLFPGSLTVSFLALGIAAFTPTHLALTSVVNNDGLLEVCFSWMLLVSIASLLSGFTMYRAGWIGVAIGAACLTKATGLLLFPAFLVLLLLLRRTGESPKILVRHALWTLTAAFTVCGWWFVRNGRLYGEFLPFRAFSRMFEHTALAQDVVSGKIPLGVEGWGGYARLVSSWTFQSFFAVYGTPRSAQFGVPVFLPAQVYLLAGGVVLLAGYGLTRLHFEADTETSPTQRFAFWLLFFVLGCVTLSFAAFVTKYFQAQGRYLFPAMLPISILLAAGYERASRGKYRGLLLAYGGLTFGVLCAVFFLSIR